MANLTHYTSVKKVLTNGCPHGHKEAKWVICPECAKGILAYIDQLYHYMLYKTNEVEV